MVADASNRTPALLVTHEDELRAVAARLSRARHVAVDVESNGLFKYKAALCTMQLATADEIVVVDALATPLGALAPLLGPAGPRKIVHDVAFDARILSESDLVLANVLDTSLAARMLGRTATGLASLLASELGVTVDKKLQHHDWTARPLDVHHLRYLAEDVRHLEALAVRLWEEVDERGIGDAVEEETRYRLAQAIAAARAGDPRPPYVRLKGIDRVPKDQWPILRRLADLREDKARRLDVPPYKVIGPDVLFSIAKAKPKTMADLARIRGATAGHRARALGPSMLEAVAAGLLDDGVPEHERRMLERPRLASDVIKARRAREGRLMSWRKAEAKKRGVDEQVVLPGHCLKGLAELPDDAPLEAIAAVPGIGAFRVARDGAAIRATLASQAASAALTAGADGALEAE